MSELESVMSVSKIITMKSHIITIKNSTSEIASGVNSIYRALNHNKQDCVLMY